MSEEREFATGGYVSTDYSTWSVAQLLDTPCFVFYTDEERKLRIKAWHEKLDRLNQPVLD